MYLYNFSDGVFYNRLGNNNSKKKVGDLKDVSIHGLRAGNQSLSHSIDSLGPKKEFIKLGLWERNKFVICPCSLNVRDTERRNKMKKYIDYIVTQFDIKNLLYNYHEMHLVKQMILRKDQIPLFDYVLFKEDELPKPCAERENENFKPDEFKESLELLGNNTDQVSMVLRNKVLENM